jgi:cbb3-type cytochrome oxidase subunit 1
MSVIPGNLETTQQPPMTVPLRHFVVGLGFLLLGILIGTVTTLELLTGLTTLAHVHLLLAGWICITIMGAMTQFIPVWSGTQLHSRRLSTLQLWLVTIGLLGFAGCLISGALTWLPIFGGTMVLGFWTFVYNIGRTLWSLPTYDVTVRHFGLALGFFLLLTALGFLLALDFVHPVLVSLSVSRSAVVQSHATLAVFGAVLTTVLGALYQLATMFTQTKLHGIDIQLRRIEEVGYPLGVVFLATGRLVGEGILARIGGALVIISLLGFSVILGRRLYESQVDWTPMLSRYTVVVPAMVLWAVLTIPYWFTNPLARDTLFGAPGTVHLLVLGVIGFVVLGTLYHIVPFIIWVHRYSDLLGHEAVPMIDELYSDRIAAVDFALLSGGTAILVTADLFPLLMIGAALGGVLVLVGALLFIANIVRVIRDHSPHSLPGVLFSTFQTDQNSSSEESIETADGR